MCSGEEARQDSTVTDTQHQHGTHVVVAEGTEDLLRHGGQGGKQCNSTPEGQQQQQVWYTGEGVLELVQVRGAVLFPAGSAVAGWRWRLRPEGGSNFIRRCTTDGTTLTRPSQSSDTRFSRSIKRLHSPGDAEESHHLGHHGQPAEDVIKGRDVFYFRHKERRRHLCHQDPERVS